MPKPGPPSKERGADLAIIVALTLGPPPSLGTPDVPGVLSEEDLEDAYRLHRERLIDQARPCTRPWGYWRYERGVPEQLRAELPRLSPVAPNAPAGKSGNVEEAVHLEREIARLEYLAEGGHLDPDELELLPRVQRELQERHLRAVEA